MVRLIGDLWAVSGKLLTHDWDANGFLLAGNEPTLGGESEVEEPPADSGNAVERQQRHAMSLRSSTIVAWLPKRGL